jgi:6-phosphogluconolactonase
MLLAMSAGSLERFADQEAASFRAALLTAEAVREAVAERGRAALALSGGSTPGRYFELLAEQGLPWDKVHIFWVDERLVPLDAPESNYRLAWERLLSRVSLPTSNIHPMWVEQVPNENTNQTESVGSGAVQKVPVGMVDPEKAAWTYENMLRRFFGDGAIPEFDVIHLGLGGDGHTASLFPGQPALDERVRWVLPVTYAGATPLVSRLTLTLPVINAARNVFFLVSGPDKTKLAENAASGHCGGCPAGRVRPGGNLVWLLGG